MFVLHKHRALTAARWFAHRKGCPEAKAQLRLLFIVVSRDPNLSQRSPAGRVEQKPGPVAAYRPPVLRGLFLARLIDLFVTQAIKNEKKKSTKNKTKNAHKKCFVTNTNILKPKRHPKSFLYQFYIVLVFMTGGQVYWACFVVCSIALVHHKYPALPKATCQGNYSPILYHIFFHFG